jgi:hypothetical protein
LEERAGKTRRYCVGQGKKEKRVKRMPDPGKMSSFARWRRESKVPTVITNLAVSGREKENEGEGPSHIKR